MVFGGVAYYWGFLRKGESVAQSVDRLLFAPNGKLRGEFDTFERVCLMHIREIKRTLQIGGVKTGVCSWRHVADETYGKGAQIDLLIDRADNVVNVCVHGDPMDAHIDAL